LPGKNTKLLNGKPLLQYSIETAKKLPEISDIFVSTDCDSIAAVAIRNGVHVIQRPSELATDASPEWMAWRHAIEYVKSNYRPFDIFVSLPATSPLRSKEDINSALKKLQTPSADICISVTPANRNPYFNMVRLRPNGFAELVIEPKEALGRRQDAPEVFDMTTAVYAAKVRFIEQNTSVFSGRVVATVVPKCRAVDIDDIYDFMLAEAVLKSELVNG
jgi:N-acylneuraminate cytidylyltransferase